ncbi:unnamed protein product [Cunninghamella blakesleeana]
MSSATSAFSTRNDKAILPIPPSSSTSTSSTLMSDYLNPSIKNEDQVAQEISQQLLNILKSDQDIQYSIPSLEVLRKRSLNWHKIQEKGLFKIVVQLKDKAQQKKSVVVNNMTEDLINQWYDLQQQQHRSNSVISPKPSPTSSPIQSNEPMRLAIQKDPPQKPKAISNTSSFFASLGSNTPTTNTKPFSASKLVSSQQQQSKQPFQLDQVLQQMKSPPSSSSTSASDLNRKRTFENNNHNNIANYNYMSKNNNIDTNNNSSNSNSNSNSNNTSSNFKSESFSSSTAMTKKRRKGNFRVTFKPDHCLVEVREYEKQPEEWNANMHHVPVAEARDLELDEAQVMSQAFHHQSPTPPSTPKHQQQHLDPRLAVSYRYNQPYQQEQKVIDKYYPPKLIRLPDDVQLPTPQSNEALVHTEREKVTIAAIYSSLSHIPYTPQEPDEIPDENNHTPIIPLESTDLLIENQQQQQPTASLLQQPFVYQSPPISQSTLHSPPLPQQHSFISTSMNYSHLNQQPTSPSLQSSTFLQTTTNPTFIPQQQYQQPATFVNISNQQLQQPQQLYYNYSQPPPLQQQQQHQHQQPALTNDQLSNLFNNPDVINKLKEALQNTTAVTSTYHPPEPQQTGSIPLNDYQDNKKNISRPIKKFRKQRSGPICRFYGTSKGCRTGNDCPFSHID